MSQLLVRNVDDRIAARLKRAALRNGISVEEQHRRILRDALAQKRSFKEALAAIPAAGEDGDFARENDQGREIDL